MYRFGIFGSDARMKYLEALLRGDGYEAQMFKDGQLDKFIQENDVIVLPVSRSFDDILPLCTGKIVAGGFIGDTPSVDGVGIINYAASDYFKVRNALPTAEGALSIAMQRTDYTLCDSNTVVVGYGNIGKCLTDQLLCLGASVTVAARKESDRAQAENYGAAACDINALRRLRPDVIFNTVPALVIDKPVLEHIDPNTLIIDLASMPGGTDFKYAEKSGITAIHSLGLPGKYAPKTAGDILKCTIISLLSEV